MKLTQLSIRNFKSIKSLDLKFPESGILILVGENNAGKSNIIRAIDAVCGDIWYGKGKEGDSDYYRRTKENNLEIALTFSNEHHVSLNLPSSGWGLTHNINGRKAPFGTLNIKELFPCTYLAADRNFDRQMGLYDYTLIGRIRKAFNGRVPEVEGLSQAMKERFDELMDLFYNVPGFKEFKSDFSDNFERLFPLNSSRMNIDFKAFTPRNLFNTIQITAEDKQQPGIYQDLNELGEGARNILLISLLTAYAKNFKGTSGQLNGILALEEPELFLHPQAQRHLAHSLRELALSGYQVVISTHSDSFLDTEFFDSIGRVVKVDDPDCPNQKCTEVLTCSVDKLIEKCVNSGVPSSKVTKESIREFYGTTSNARLNEAFFARLLILVEGETEELALKEYLLACDINCDALGISIVAVGGKMQLPKYWRLYSSFDIPIIVVFDDDGSTVDAHNANKQLALCFGIDFNVFSVSIGKHAEYYITSGGEKILVVEKDFEHSIESELGKELYDQYLMEAKEIIKPLKNAQKGVVARFVARKAITEKNFQPTVAKLLADEIRRKLLLSTKEEMATEVEILDDNLSF